MDPVLLKLYDQKLFDEYIDLYYGNNTALDLKIIQDDFHAKWVLAQKNSFNKIGERLQQNPQLFEKVFENKGYVIYAVK